MFFIAYQSNLLQKEQNRYSNNQSKKYKGGFIAKKSLPDNL